MTDAKKGDGHHPEHVIMRIPPENDILPLTVQGQVKQQVIQGVLTVSKPGPGPRHQPFFAVNGHAPLPQTGHAIVFRNITVRYGYQ
ncbi:hypothetical protein DVF53_23385 [Salmonella enterica subsp. enterica serovar Kottbus]|nr:hypothetical protein [Salmonella enterica subsp. enterica serovar Kottbus]